MYVVVSKVEVKAVVVNNCQGRLECYWLLGRVRLGEAKLCILYGRCRLVVLDVCTCIINVKGWMYVGKHGSIIRCM